MGEPQDALEHSSEEASDEEQMTQDGTDLMLGLTPISMNLDHFHPPQTQILELWRVFLENVDPVTKVLHGPSLQPLISKASLGVSSKPKSLEALLFAVYSAAVVSLADQDCKQRFGEPRKTLLSRYRQASKVALSRARFISSANIVVLQAFFIHLLSMQEVYDSRTLWTLTGVALRMAEGMGLHRNGSFLKLSLFDAEIRNRIWWQLKIFDGDSAELSGAGKFTISDVDPKTPQLPANVNDNELYPAMTSIPVNAGRATDMIFCALRYELRSYWTSSARSKTLRITETSSLQNMYGTTDRAGAMSQRDEAIDEFERVLEDKYVRYCDPSIPVQLMATVAARAAVSTSRLIAHHPRTWSRQEDIPESERQYVWSLSLKGLRQYNMIHSNPDLQRFAWHAVFYFRWQPFIHVLDTLRVNPLISEADQAWHLIDQVYETNPEFVTNTKKALYVAVGNLCLKAHNAREAALEKRGQRTGFPPSYVVTFHRQREAMNSRRKTRELGVQHSKHQSERVPSVPKLPLQPHLEKSQEEPSQLPHSQSQYTPFPQSTDSQQPEYISGSGGTWIPNNGYEQSNWNLGSIDNDASMDLSPLFNLDFPMEEPMNQTIDWEKWDALLGNFT